ncbi:uncharacterized protein [Nothobranchius furzeri]|uniref:uncharacterized protein n=1 Tax=Nothobranchius furzeri TaxID=105023 RepID=UPI003904C4E8
MSSNARTCPACQTGSISSGDLHIKCEVCLGAHHVGLALTPQASCPFCAALPVAEKIAALLEGRHVEVHTDNQVAAAYINRHGGVQSVATDLLCWAHVHLLSIKATYIPGFLNVAADILSRGGPRDSDWRLHPALISQIWIKFGEPSVDLFAARENAQCRLWFSLSPRDHPPLGADTFSRQPWPQTLLYAFPPVPLIPRLLDRVRSEQLSVILVAPRRLSASWFPDLQALVSDSPWRLPWRADALLQADGIIKHPPEIGQWLWVWPLSGHA